MNLTKWIYIDCITNCIKLISYNVYFTQTSNCLKCTTFAFTLSNTSRKFWHEFKNHCTNFAPFFGFRFYISWSSFDVVKRFVHGGIVWSIQTFEKFKPWLKKETVNVVKKARQRRRNDSKNVRCCSFLDGMLTFIPRFNCNC